MADSESCTCGRDKSKPHDCDDEYKVPYPGPGIEIAPDVWETVCLNCGGVLTTIRNLIAEESQ